MKLTIESTDKFVETAEGKFRLWIGTTPLGNKCAVLVNGVLPETKDNPEEYADLQHVTKGQGSLMLSKQGYETLVNNGSVAFKKEDFQKMTPEDVFAAFLDGHATKFEENYGHQKAAGDAEGQ